MKILKMAGEQFNSRLFLGTGKFSSGEQLRDAVLAAGTELVTVSLKRTDFSHGKKDILSSVPKSVKVMINTSGARDAKDAVRIAKLAESTGHRWIKLEIHPEQKYLLPDPIETMKAAEQLVKEGFIVLPYINADPVLARKLEDAGVHAVMPLGAPIGSNQGLRTEAMLRIIIEQCSVPVVIDAGLGMPSHAAAAIEMGADAVLVNTAIACADNPALMAEAFKLAVISAEKALASGPSKVSSTASPSSPFDLFSL